MELEEFRFYSILNIYNIEKIRFIEQALSLINNHEQLASQLLKKITSQELLVGTVDVIKFLVKNGANVSSLNYRSLYNIYKSNGNFEIIKLLVESGASIRSQIYLLSRIIIRIDKSCCDDAIIYTRNFDVISYLVMRNIPVIYIPIREERNTKNFILLLEDARTTKEKFNKVAMRDNVYGYKKVIKMAIVNDDLDLLKYLNNKFGTVFNYWHSCVLACRFCSIKTMQYLLLYKDGAEVNGKIVDLFFHIDRIDMFIFLFNYIERNTLNITNITGSDIEYTKKDCIALCIINCVNNKNSILLDYLMKDEKYSLITSSILNVLMNKDKVYIDNYLFISRKLNIENDTIIERIKEIMTREISIFQYISCLSMGEIEVIKEIREIREIKEDTEYISQCRILESMIICINRIKDKNKHEEIKDKFANSGLLKAGNTDYADYINSLVVCKCDSEKILLYLLSIGFDFKKKELLQYSLDLKNYTLLKLIFHELGKEQETVIKLKYSDIMKNYIEEEV